MTAGQPNVESPGRGIVGAQRFPEHSHLLHALPDHLSPTSTSRILSGRYSAATLRGRSDAHLSRSTAWLLESAVATDDLLIERLLRVIDEGRRTATYKLALLLGIVDAAAMSPGESTLPTRLIAERVLALYYPQTRPYIDISGAAHHARQIVMKTSSVLTAIEGLRSRAEVRRCRSIDEVHTALPADYLRTLDVVEETFVRYPIPLMQVVGAGVVPFLYEVDWPEGTSVKILRKRAQDQLRLLDGVADRLVVLGPMLRPLIELHWTRDVAKWTRLPMEDEALRAHLFGSDRIGFPHALVTDLCELQGQRCFYCGDQLGTRREVDHFLAWSRWPNDAIENLVIADRCNGAKSDHLAATEHLVRWRLRVEAQAAALAALAKTHHWLTSPDRARALVQSTYSHVAAGTPLWIRGKEFEIVVEPLLS
jgi:HNH endonuclease